MSFEVYQRNDLLIPITIKDEEGNVLNIAGCSLFFVVRNGDGEEPVIQKSIGNGITVIDAGQGEIEVKILNQDTDIPLRYYKCELLIIDLDGNRYTGLKEGFNVKESLTAKIDI